MCAAGRGWLAVLLLAAASGVWAVTPGLPGSWTTQAGAVASQVSGTAVSVSSGGASELSRLLNLPRTPTRTADGGALLRDLLRGPGPAGKTVDYGLNRVMTWGALAGTVARFASPALTILAVAQLTAELRCREGFAASWECDAGQGEVPRNIVRTQVFTMSGSGATPWLNKRCEGPDYGFLAGCVQSAASGAHNGARNWTCTASQCQGEIYTSYWFWSTVSVDTPTIAQICPAVTHPSNPALNIPEGSPVGPDGKCPTGQYTGTTPEAMESKITNYGDKAKAPNIWPGLISAGLPIPHSGPTVDIPSPQVQGDRQIETRPDGITVRDWSYDVEPTAEGYKWREKVTERTYPPGTTVPPQGDPTAPPPDVVIEGPGGSSGPGGGPAPEIITCGLPSTPPCKVDEGGTPPPPPPNAFDPTEDPVNPLRALITDPQIPEVEFTWSFALPSSCSVITLEAFSPWLVQVDMCRWQPMIHDIMTVVWSITGVLGAASILIRTFGSS